MGYPHQTVTTSSASLPRSVCHPCVTERVPIPTCFALLFIPVELQQLADLSQSWKHIPADGDPIS